MTDRSKATTHADDCWSWEPGHYKCAVGKIERLRTENERLREDAARYRWLKQHAFCGVWHRGDGLALVAPRVIQREVDAAIDRARKGEQ